VPAAAAVTVHRILAAGVWALPVHTALLTVGTLTHQPDWTTDFSAYAAYLVTPQFLASHLGASIAGGAIGLLGTVAVALLIALRGPVPGRALLGGALTLIGATGNIALFGVAAFAQPAIGRAHQAGDPFAVSINEDVYGTPLMVTALTGLLIYLIGAVVLGLALGRTDPALRWAGLTWAIAVPVFVISGLLGLVLQPIAAAVLTVAGLRIARVLTRKTVQANEIQGSAS